MTFFDLAGEIRNQIYGELLPDVEISAAMARKTIRKDGAKSSTTFMATCLQVYQEAVSILYPATIPEQLEVNIDSAGTSTFLGRRKGFAFTKPSNFSVLSRVTRLHFHIEIGKSLEPADVCVVQDAMFNVTKLLCSGHQLEGISACIAIGADPRPYRVWDAYNSGVRYLFQGIFGGYRDGGNLARMQEFRNVKPGDISRAHIAAFLTDPLRTIRGVKNGPKWKVFGLSFPGKTGRPWRDLQGQVYDLIRSTAAVPDFGSFTRYFDALRQLKRIFYSFGEQKNAGPVSGNIQVYDEHASELSQARIRGDARKFRELHAELLAVIDNSIVLRIDFNKTNSYQMAEIREHWCREMIYLKIELEAALPSEDLDVSFRGYNIADAGLHQWQTVGRKEAREAKRKRKADTQARVKAAKKARTGEKTESDADESEEESD